MRYLCRTGGGGQAKEVAQRRFQLYFKLKHNFHSQNILHQQNVFKVVEINLEKSFFKVLHEVPKNLQGDTCLGPC
jgi:hypothetical protein